VAAIGAPRAWRGKRLFDVLATAIILVLAGPVLAACAAVVWVVDGPPVIFRQERVGRLGRLFTLLKLRTMRPGAGDLLTRSGDPRVTPLGRMLRRAKLDELPQLFNVLRGDMSLVGPRPEVPTYAAAQPHAFRALADLRPGITDWASLAFRDEELVLEAHRGDGTFYLRRLLPRKLALARLYHRHWGIGLDLRLCLATVCLALGADGLMRTLAGRRLLARARRGIAETPALAPGARAP